MHKLYCCKRVELNIDASFCQRNDFQSVANKTFSKHQNNHHIPPEQRNSEINYAPKVIVALFVIQSSALKEEHVKNLFLSENNDNVFASALVKENDNKHCQGLYSMASSRQKSCKVVKSFKVRMPITQMPTIIHIYIIYRAVSSKFTNCEGSTANLIFTIYISVESLGPLSENQLHYLHQS